ncbi:hypothetical protein B0O80DRAFT_503828 [Mortierella sp. GBAus27b]|nr:hypothetical protein B0O80DRAFT_503828 [Mortierella sp. GBAus27b]
MPKSLCLKQRGLPRKHPDFANDIMYQPLRDGVATAYIDLGKYLGRRGYHTEATSICKKAEKWGGSANDPGRLAQLSRPTSMIQPPDEASTSDKGLKDPKPVQESQLIKIKQRPTVALIATHIFSENVRPQTTEHKLPQPDERLSSTPQLVCCLGLLQASHSPGGIIETDAHKWLQVIEKDADEQERLHALSKDVIRAFKRDELKDARAIAEVVCLVPVLNKETYHDLLREFYSGIDHSGLLNCDYLEGIAQLIQGADPGHLNADDLVKILDLLSTRLMNTHRQSTHHMHQLTLAVSHVLDAMADTKVTGIDREKLHEPLSTYLGDLKKSKDPFLVYQAAYAYQALLCVPDNETAWQAATRRTGKVIKGVAGLVSAAKGFDLERFINGLTDIQEGLGGVSKVIEVVKTGYEGVTSLAKSGQGFVKCLKEGLSFERRREWYAALRGADTLIRDGELATFKKLVCGAPRRYDPAFQWGVCQRLGEMAANPTWDAVTRRSAITFLGEIYRDDDMWGQHPNVKQWILNILMQLASTTTSGSSGTVMQLHAIVAETLLQELEACQDAKKQELYRSSRINGPTTYPLKVTLPELGSPSLLDQVQNRPDVEGNIRVLRKQRTKQRGSTVYIPPQAKPNVQSSDDARFPLMERVRTFLESEQKVFLLLGDSGAGKSTFTRELEFDMWQTYENKTGRIPLYINLPAIEKPEHDMIAKQLRKNEFTEPQIREMKHHRKFILICDGYDESQQSHNLYMTNKLNQPGEWDAQMVISCRSEYLGVDYRDQFQPGGDRNMRSDSTLFQEAVVAPFSMDQVQAYIQQYVATHQPMWRAEDYKQALDLIPSLKDLVKNPFLMTLSLDVLPRMMDPGKHLSAAHVTRVALYDHFVEQWLERGKKRLGEKDMSRQTKAAFEKLSAEGFTLSGIEYLKALAVAIYKEQGGNPVVEYCQLVDEKSWKGEFFERKHKQLLLEACPLTRNGNQHRFIHRSLLEYGLARAVFDPQDRRNREPSETVIGRRGSTSSTLSFEITEASNIGSTTSDPVPDPESPLVWRNFVNDQSLLQFLEERVQQEHLFEKQLFAYIEHSKLDKKWRTAAANAITILVRSGVQFNGKDLCGIQIPGADLSYGVFGSAQLCEADLRKVNLCGIWMPQADLTEAQMSGVQFGELPYLNEDAHVWSCAYSPDGSRFAVGLGNGNISVYTTSDWNKVTTLRGHWGEVISVAYSPNSGQVVSASRDKTVCLWNVESETCQHIFIVAAAVNCVAYSPRANQVAIGGDDSTTTLRDPITGECSRVLAGHTGSVIHAAYSPNGKEIATGGGDCTVRLWNVDSGTCTHILIGPSGYIWGIAYSPQSEQIASAGSYGTILLWDMKTWRRHHALNHTSGITSIAYSPKSDQIVSSSEDNTVRIWDVESGANIQTFTGHHAYIPKAVYSPLSNHIASGSLDKKVRLWDVSTGVSRFVSSDRKELSMIACSPAGNQFASFGSGDTVQIMEAGTGVCRKTLNANSGTVRSVVYSPQGDMILSWHESGSVLLWNLDTGVSQHLCTLRAIWQIMRVLVPPTERMVASGSSDSIIRLWNIENSTYQHTLYCTSCIISLAFSPQEHQLASSESNKSVRIWDMETGDCLMILVSHHSMWYNIFITYSQDGHSLISGCDNELRLWDVASGQCRSGIQVIRGVVQEFTRGSSSEGVHVVTRLDKEYSWWKIIDKVDRFCLIPRRSIPSGALDVSGATIQDVRGLSQLNKQLLKQRGAQGDPEFLLLEASKKVVAMTSVLSRLGQPTERTNEEHQKSPITERNQLATTGPDDRVRVWDLDTGDCLMILIGHFTRYLDITISYSLNGDTLISGGDDVIRLWDVTSGRCRAMLTDVHGNVWNFIRRGTLEDILVVTSSDSGDVVWKIVDEGDRCHLSALWISATGALDVTGATIQDARGLSLLNKQLLKQRGAKGEPESLLMEKSKKLVAMASVLSKLREPMESTSEQQQTSSTTQLPREQVELEVEQPDDTDTSEPQLAVSMVAEREIAFTTYIGPAVRDQGGDQHLNNFDCLRTQFKHLDKTALKSRNNNTHGLRKTRIPTAMVFTKIVPSHLDTLSLQQALELTNVYLENAYRTKDSKVAMVLCHNAEVALSQAKKADKKHSAHPGDASYEFMRESVAMAYIDLGKHLESRGYQNEAIALCKKAEKWGGNANDPGRLAQQSRSTSTVIPQDEISPTVIGSKGTIPVQSSSPTKTKQRPMVAVVAAHIFQENVRPPAIQHKLPQPDERLSTTPQLVCCLGLLQASHSSDDILEPVAQEWLQVIEKDADEQERLHALSNDVIRAYMKDELKDAKAVAEVVCLTPVLDKDSFHDLLREFYSGLQHSGLLNFQLLEGLAQLIQGADPGHLNADDLVKILELLSVRLRDTHQQSAHHMYKLTMAVSHVLDAMADTRVTGLDRKNLHEPLSNYLSGLMNSSDPFLVYQAAYAYQALICVPDNETTWQAAMRRTGKVIQGIAGLVSAVKGLDLEKFMDGLSNIQKGVEGVSKVIEVAKTAYEGVSSLAKSGQGLITSLKEGLSFERRREWYAALRGADTLIRDGELASFKKLVCEAPCRYDAAFQWGVCQRLGEMAANPTWDAVTRRSAITFLGEIYRDDDMWGQQASVKQWILNILMQLSSTKNSGSSAALQLHAIVAKTLLEDLDACDDPMKLELYRGCRTNGPVAYPLKIALPELGSPSLLDRVQNRPDVEGNIRVLRKQRTKDRGIAVYIPPQAKPNIQSSDDTRFSLMERVKEFLGSDQKVYLLLGDSGAGKSTFSRELEFELWQSYENKTGRIPLHINLPAIENPEHDMIAKQLRKNEFTEPQIREMKHHRRFILICDGYDESQQTHNLYMTNKLNQPGEWDAQMVISCRSEYLGVDYRDRFQPGGDRNTRSDSMLFQEAVVAPFTMDQVQAYIEQFVIIHQPLWRIEDYKQALDLIPSLKDCGVMLSVVARISERWCIFNSWTAPYIVGG